MLRSSLAMPPPTFTAILSSVSLECWAAMTDWPDEKEPAWEGAIEPAREPRLRVTNTCIGLYDGKLCMARTACAVRCHAVYHVLYVQMQQLSCYVFCTSTTTLAVQLGYRIQQFCNLVCVSHTGACSSVTPCHIAQHCITLQECETFAQGVTSRHTKLFHSMCDVVVLILLAGCLVRQVKF